MAYCLIDAKPLSEPMLEYCQLDKLQWNSNQNTKLFIHENAFKNAVCQTGSHFVLGEWVKTQKGHISYLWTSQLCPWHSHAAFLHNTLILQKFKRKNTFLLVRWLNSKWPMKYFMRYHGTFSAKMSLAMRVKLCSDVCTAKSPLCLGHKNIFLEGSDQSRDHHRTPGKWSTVTNEAAASRVKHRNLRGFMMPTLYSQAALDFSAACDYKLPETKSCHDANFVVTDNIEEQELLGCQLCGHRQETKKCYDANFVIIGSTRGWLVNTPCGAASDDKVGIMKILGFREAKHYY